MKKGPPLCKACALSDVTREPSRLKHQVRRCIVNSAEMVYVKIALLTCTERHLLSKVKWKLCKENVTMKIKELKITWDFS